MFAHRLVAAGIGGRTVSELSESMSVEEFIRWMAFDDMFPLAKLNENFARLAHLIASVHTPKNASRPRLRDYLLGNPPQQNLTADELEQRLMAQFGGNDARPD